jgi:hypothetical protein
MQSNGRDWFERYFGFTEPKNYEDVRDHFRLGDQEDGGIILHAVSPPKAGMSNATRSFHVGWFETPSVSELTARLVEHRNHQAVCLDVRGLTFQHIVGDAGALHRDPQNEGAVFQAASQFNALEMVDPSITPEHGITGYEFDRTQGPSCALACPAGTLYRNYFVNGTGQGGPHGKQLDLLEDVGLVLGNNPKLSSLSSSPTNNKFWHMKNGYALAASSLSIQSLHDVLHTSPKIRDAAQQQLRVAIQWHTEVDTYSSNEMPFQVTQVYCSALPIQYDHTATATRHWEPFARLVLDAAYEATFAAAAFLCLHRGRGQRVKLYLTKVGGGAFGNQDSWISDAISRSLQQFKAYPLDVSLVHYGHIEDHYYNRIMGP